MTKIELILNKSQQIDLELEIISEIKSDDDFILWLSIVDETIEAGYSIPSSIICLKRVLQILEDQEKYEWCAKVQNKINTFNTLIH